MQGDDFQPDSRRSQGYYIEGGRLQVPGSDAGPVRQQLAGCQTEYLKDESDLERLGKLLRREGQLRFSRQRFIAR